MPELIGNIRFLEWGKKAPKGSRFKGTITTESIIGYYEYTGRKEAAETSQERTINDEGYLGYTSRQGELRTFSSIGWLDQKKAGKFKDLIKKSFNKKGNLIWDTVISLEDYVVAHDKQMINADDYVAVAAKVLPSFFKYAGFEPDNMGWWMDYHSDKGHPHIHLVFFEKQQTVTKGKLPQKCVDKYKSLFIKEIALRQEFKKKYGMESKDFFKLCDQDKHALLDSIKNQDLSGLSDLRKLYSKLPHSGRLSYNSKPIAPLKKDIDFITDQILSKGAIKELYDQWIQKVDQLENLQNDYANDTISSFKETEINKLYVQVGNIILRSFKNYRKEMSTREVTIPMDAVYETADGMIVDIDGQQIILDPAYAEVYDEHMQIDLTQDTYLCIDPETGDTILLDQEEMVEALKSQMKNDEDAGKQPNLKMAFSGYHSKQVRNKFPTDVDLARAVYQAVAQQLHEKEKDLDVFLHGKKEKKVK